MIKHHAYDGGVKLADWWLPPNALWSFPQQELLHLMACEPANMEP